MMVLYYHCFCYCCITLLIVNHFGLKASAKCLNCKLSVCLSIQLLLNGKEMTFDPSLEAGRQGNFYEGLDRMVTGICRMASFIPRVAAHSMKFDFDKT